MVQSLQFPTHTPTVIGTIMTAPGLRFLGRAGLASDAAEVRVDALLADKVGLDKIEAALAKRQVPVLLTLRIPPEGGKREWIARERREIFLRLMPHVEAVDLELATFATLRPVAEAARQQKKTVILSAHAIESPLLPAQIAKWIELSGAQPDAILKIAGLIESWRDLQQLAAVLVNHPDRPVAVMGLGPYAAQSRSVLAALGSRLVYGYLDRPAALGQPSAAEVRKMVGTLQQAG